MNRETVNGWRFENDSNRNQRKLVNTERKQA